jgi:hypothetical protein
MVLHGESSKIRNKIDSKSQLTGVDTMPNEDYNIDNLDNLAKSGKERGEMTTTQAAQVLRVHPRTMARYLATDKIPSRSLNLRDRVVAIDDLRNFAAAHKLQIDEELAQSFLSQ